MKRRLALGLLVLFGTMAGAAEVSVTHHEINLSPAEGEAMATLCAQRFALASGEGAQVRVPEGPGPGPTLALELIGLSHRSIIVDASLKDAAGALVHHVQLEASSLEDAPVVCERLATALTGRTSVDDVRTRSNITRAEARASRSRSRLSSEKVLGLNTRMLLPMATGLVSRPAWSVGFDGRFEQDRFFIEVSAGFIAGSPTTSSLDLTMGGVYVSGGAALYLSEADTAAYVGLGIEPRLLLWPYPSIGIAPYAQFGVMLWRQSSTRLYAELRLAQNVMPVRVGTSTIPTTQLAYPTEAGLALGVGW